MDKEKEREIFNKFIRKITHFVSGMHSDFSEEEKRIISKYDYDETVLNTVSLVLAKKGEKAFTTDRYKKLEEQLFIHRNKKGKLWRENIYKEAKRILKENPSFSKTKCLKIAFEHLPKDQNNEKDFNLHFKSILDSFYKLTNSQPKNKKKKS